MIRIRPRNQRQAPQQQPVAAPTATDVSPSILAEPPQKLELERLEEPEAPRPATVVASAPSSSGFGAGLGYFAAGLGALLSFFLLLVSRRGWPAERLRKLDAWSLPQGGTVAALVAAGSTSSIPILILSSALAGLGLALSMIVARSR